MNSISEGSAMKVFPDFFRPAFKLPFPGSLSVHPIVTSISARQIGRFMKGDWFLDFKDTSGPDKADSSDDLVPMISKLNIELISPSSKFIVNLMFGTSRVSLVIKTESEVEVFQLETSP